MFFFPRLPTDPKASSSQLTQEQLTLLLNLLQSKSTPGAAQFAGLPVTLDALQQLAQKPPGKAENVPEATAAVPGQARTEGEDAGVGTQAAFAVLLAQLLNAQQKQAKDSADQGEALECSAESKAAVGAPEPPPEPSPLSPGKVFKVLAVNPVVSCSAVPGLIVGPPVFSISLS